MSWCKATFSRIEMVLDIAILRLSFFTNLSMSWCKASFPQIEMVFDIAILGISLFTNLSLSWCKASFPRIEMVFGIAILGLRFGIQWSHTPFSLSATPGGSHSSVDCLVKEKD